MKETDERVDDEDERNHNRVGGFASHKRHCRCGQQHKDQRIFDLRPQDFELADLFGAGDFVGAMARQAFGGLLRFQPASACLQRDKDFFDIKRVP